MHHKRGKAKSSRAGCLRCKPWKHQGENGSTRPDMVGARNFRLTQDSIEDLLPDEPRSQIDRELTALYCDNEFCPCRFSGEEYEERLWEQLTGETAQKLAKMGVTVTWTRDPDVPCYLTIG